MRVKDVMDSKPFVLYEEDTVLHASKFMKEERVRNLPVVDTDGRLIGLITLREIIEAILSHPDEILVKDAMIKLITSVGPDTPLKGAIEVMLVNKYGCLPVVDKNKKLLGMISEASLLKVLYTHSTMPSDFYETK